MDEKSFTEMVRDSLDYIERKSTVCEKRYKLGQFHRMDYEQETGEILFSGPGVLPKVVAEFQVIGSLSSRSNTWLWAWDNPYLLENIATAASEVRKFGEKHNLDKLTNPRWKATEKDAREMTALAAHILRAEGTYNFPSDDIMVYVVFTEIKWIGAK